MKLDFADIKPGMYNWLIIGLSAVTFIAISKWALSKWRLPGISDIVMSV